MFVSFACCDVGSGGFKMERRAYRVYNRNSREELGNEFRIADWKSAGGPSAFRDPKFLLPFRDPHSAIRNSLPIYFCQDFGESRCPNLPGVAA